ncbi:MAG TPA: prepilin peptidase [Candidatus Polarisedimenticolia bacterium]|nr:prepilin peptidase [Candidatus Polarisedimenticolia bacterium]
MSLLIQAFVLALGAVIGSFLNVVIHRLPRRESVVFPPSACPSCGSRIHPLDNVPILSFLLLRGRCRRCSAPISPRYFLVEALTAACTLLLFVRLGPTVTLAIYLPFAWALIALAFIDAEHQILPDKITLPGIAVSALVPLLGRLHPWSPVVERLSWGSWAAGVVLGAAMPYLVVLAYRLSQLRKPPDERVEGMGMGDVKMLAMVGGFLGWKLVLLTLFAGSVLGSAWGLGGMAVRRYGMKHALPFGTFLAIGAFLSLLAGPALLAWYAGWLPPEE